MLTKYGWSYVHAYKLKLYTFPESTKKNASKCTPNESGQNSLVECATHSKSAGSKFPAVDTSWCLSQITRRC